MAANESSAVYSIRTINTAQVTYATTYPYGWAMPCAQHAGRPHVGGNISSANAGILDWVLGCSQSTVPEERIQFRDRANAPGAAGSLDSYSCLGNTGSVGITGYRGFCSDNMNPVQYDPTGGNNCTQPLQ